MYIQRTNVREQGTRKLTSENVCLIPSSIFVSSMNASQRHCSRSSLPMLLHKIVYSALDRTFLLRIHHYFVSRKNSWFGKYFITHCVSGQCAIAEAKCEWRAMNLSENKGERTQWSERCELMHFDQDWIRLISSCRNRNMARCICCGQIFRFLQSEVKMVLNITLNWSNRD